MWAPEYASGEELAAWLGVTEDAHHGAATEAASRAIDAYCGRQFGQTETEPRYFTPVRERDYRWTVTIDDLMDDPSIEQTDGDGNVLDTVTGTPWPLNAAAKGEPWRQIHFGRSVSLNGNPLRITAKWGWSAVPNPVKSACLLQAARWNDRRENITGSLTGMKIDDIDYQWSNAAGRELDADVIAMIKPYRRLSWVAA